MTFWLIDLRCGACPFRHRSVHPLGEVLDYVCPHCKTPIMAYRLVGIIGARDDDGLREAA